MTANEFKAKAAYDAYNQALIEHWFRDATKPNGADYGYRNGWVVVGDDAFPVEKWYPNNQPYWD